MSNMTYGQPTSTLRPARYACCGSDSGPAKTSVATARTTTSGVDGALSSSNWPIFASATMGDVLTMRVYVERDVSHHWLLPLASAPEAAVSCERSKSAPSPTSGIEPIHAQKALASF